MSLIGISELSKHFKLLARREGVRGAFLDLFSRNYSTVKAVDSISVSIEEGEVVGFIGPNGAGKSTTIKMLTGVLKPTSGSVVVDGFVPYEEREKYVKNIGVVIGQRTQLWWDIPVIESFKILKAIYEIDKRTFDENIALFNEVLDLEKLFPVPVRKLSLGQRMLCDIAASFLHNPKIIFLDEPSIGLDISVKGKVRNIIKEMGRTKNTTIIITSHDIGDIEALCKRIVLIDKGRIIYDGELSHFNTILGSFRTLKINIKGMDGMNIEAALVSVHACIGENPGCSIKSTEGGWFEITIDEDKTELLAVLRTLIATFPVKDVEIEEMALEDVIRKVYESGM